MAIPKLDFEIDDDILRDLLFLARNAGKIEEVINAAGEVTPGTGADTTIEHVTEKVKMAEADAARILYTVHNILRTQMRIRIDVPQFLEAATRELEDKATDKEGKDNLKLWKEAAESLRSVLGKLGPDHPFAVTRKAERLARAHENMLFESKVMTDLRPVFNAAGDKILHSVIAHSLLIDYFDGGNICRMEIGLDAEHLVQLRAACERAERKAITIRDTLKGIPWVEKAEE